MPNYDLRCISCNHEYKIHATMAEKSEKRVPCPDCGSFELETLFKAPPAYVKGAGAANCPHRGGCGSHCPKMMG
jgi:putative FmdB family regulatory protein